MPDTLRHGRTLVADDVGALTDFAADILPTLQLEDGLFCFDRTWADPTLRGSSVRYSTMVLLGSISRVKHGRPVGFDLESLHRRIHFERRMLGVGDLGLLLWADLRLDDPIAAETLEMLSRRSLRPGALTDLAGMEIGWFACGAAAAYAAGMPARAIVDAAIEELRRRGSATNPLLRHTGGSCRRAELPNFATEVYGLLALTEFARLGLDPTAQERAVRLADRLIELQRADGGWPWLFHAERNTVVEPYEIYSVHQDAMAPMAMLALESVIGDGRYRQAALEGLRWCFGENELSFNFYDTTVGFAHRSIRRRRHVARLDLWTNAALGSSFGTHRRLDLGGREINATCRPYHLGWILEAWSR